MKKIIPLALVALFSTLAFPAHAIEAWQAFDCVLEGDETENSAIAAGEKWLKAARSMEGGEELRASVHFPVAAGGAGDSDFKLILIAPSFKAWGTFWDGYDGSPAHKVDQENDEITTCSKSRLFEGVVIKVE
jgi:hypothetical protein